MSEKHVFADRDDEQGMYKRWVTLEGGALSIEGHDLGPGVADAFGYDEYEWVRTVEQEAVGQLQTLLNVADGASLIEAIAARFTSSSQLEQFLEEHDIESSFWSRIGD